MVDSENYSQDIQDLVSREQIRRCIQRYTRSADRHDRSLMATAFWPDAEIGYLDRFVGDRDAFITWVNDLHEDNYLAHQHHVTGQHIELEGDDAHVESYVIFFIMTKEHRTRLGSGRYIERYQRREGEWRILIREYQPEFYTDVGLDSSISPARPFLPNGPSRWDETDISYLRPFARRFERCAGQ